MYDTFAAHKPLQETNTQLVGASGEALKTFGKVVLIVTIADNTINHPFFVVEGLKTGVILGNDIMKEMGLTIDLDLEIVKTPFGNWLPIDIHKPRDEEVLQVKAIREIVIPANTSCLVKTEVPSLENNNKLPLEIYTPLRLFFEAIDTG